MFLRKLTDEELERIKKSKGTIKEQRQSLQVAVKKQRKSIQEENKRLRSLKGKDQNVDMYQPLKIMQDHLCDLQNRFNALPIITGLPVLIKLDDRSLCMNYELLKKFGTSLDKGDFWQYQLKISEKSLIIKYGKHGQNGTVEIYGLPAYQMELLSSLPTIDLEEYF